MEEETSCAREPFLIDPNTFEGFAVLFRLRLYGLVSAEANINTHFLTGAAALTPVERVRYFGEGADRSGRLVLAGCTHFVHDWHVSDQRQIEAAWIVASAMAEALAPHPLHALIRAVCLRMWGVPWTWLGFHHRDHLVRTAEVWWSQRHAFKWSLAGDKSHGGSCPHPL